MGSVLAYDALCRSGSSKQDIDNDLDHRCAGTLTSNTLFFPSLPLHLLLVETPVVNQMIWEMRATCLRAAY